MEVIQKKDNTIYLQKIGRYYLGAEYVLDELKQLHGVERFPCIQHETKFFTKITVRLIMISDTHFLLFDADNESGTLCKLIFVADIQALQKIKRMKQEQQKVFLEWKNFEQNQVIQYTFQLNDCEKLI